MIYRMVAGPDFAPLAEKMVAMGEPLPNPLLSIGFIAEDEQGNIVSHVVLQNLPVLEPVHADKTYGYTLKKLLEMAQDFILKSNAPRVLGHTSNAAMKRILRHLKAEPMADEFFDWRQTNE